MNRRRLGLLATLLLARSVVAQTQQAPAPPDIYIKENDSIVITVPNLSRVAVGDPLVVDATIVSPHEVLLQGRPISITGTSRQAFALFQEVAQTVAQAQGQAAGQTGQAGAAAPGAAAQAEAAPAFFATSNVYVWSGDQRYIYRVVVLNTTDDRARPPFLEGYRIDVVPDRLILSGIAESDERRGAAERVLQAQGFRVENKITVLDEPLVGAVRRPDRDLVYLAIQHGLLLQGMTREEAEAAIGTRPIGSPRLIREGAVTFEEYEYPPYTVRYYKDQVVSFRRHVDFDAARTEDRPAEVSSNSRLYRFKYITLGFVQTPVEIILGSELTNPNPNSTFLFIQSDDPERLRAIDRLIEQVDVPQHGQPISIARAPLPDVALQSAGSSVQLEDLEIALIRLTGVSPSEQERIVQELQDLAARIRVRRVDQAGAGLGGTGAGVTVSTSQTELNLQAVRDTLIIIESPGMIDVLVSYLLSRVERMGIEDVETAIRSGRPVRGMTLEQLNAALGRSPLGPPVPIRKPDGAIIWEYDYGDRIARFENGRLIDNAPPKDRRSPAPETLDRLVELGQIVEGMTQEQVEQALRNRGGEDPATPTSVTYDVDFDGREIWEYTYPAYFVRYREGRVLDYTPQAAAAEDTAAVRITRAFTPRSRTAEDIRNIISSFLADTTYGSASGQTVIDSATNTLIVTHYQQNMETIEEYIRLLDEQTAYQVLVEARFVELNRDATRRLGIAWNVQGQNAQGNRPFVTVNQNGSVSNPGGTAGAQQGAPGIGGISFGVIDANSFRFGHISLQDIDVVIQALEEQQQAKVLSAPRILTMQNRAATLRSVQRVFDVTVTTTTAGNPPVTTTSTTVSPRDVGVTLNVTPTVGRDGIVTLNLSPAVTAAVGTVATPGGGLINILDERSYNATVQVRSGTTLVIGGLISQNNRTNKDAVPVLSRIPLFGRLFRSDETIQDEVDLVIFINARIVAPDGGRVPEGVEGAEPPPPADQVSLNPGR